MRRATGRAALAAVFIFVLFPFPQSGGVHLVSNQPIGTDNQNNTPVHYAPKMASKLGVPQDIHREPECLIDDSLANTFRQLLESHKRQTTFLERLAALAPKYQLQELQPKKKSSKSQTKSKSSSKNSDNSVIMRAPKKKSETVVPPKQAKATETVIKGNKTEEKAPVIDNSAFSLREHPHTAHSHSTLHHCSYVRPGLHVNSPSESRLPHHVTSNPEVLSSQIVGEAIPVQSSQLLQNPYFNSVAFVPTSQYSLTLNSPQSKVLSSAHHIPNPHAILNESPHNVIPTSPPRQNPFIPQSPHSNVSPVEPHIQIPHSNNENKPLYHFHNSIGPHHNTRNTNDNKPQSTHSSLVYQSQDPLPDQVKQHSSYAREFPIYGQDPHVPHLIHRNYVSGAPIGHNTFIPHGHSHAISEVPQILHSASSNPTLNGHYPQLLYSGNSQPTNGGHPVPKHPNRHFLENPH